MSNWSELHHDLLVEIVAHIEKLEDFVAFGAVCKGWSKARKKEHFKGRLWLRQETPYLMLPVRNDNNDTREFYSLVEGEIVESIRIPKFKSRKCFESLGWLLAIDQNDGSMCLLDPFSSVEIPLPHQTTFPGYKDEAMYGYCFVEKMVLSARPSETSDFILMIIIGGCSYLSIWRPGDESWNLIEIREEAYEDVMAYADVMYHDGHFYATNYSGGVWIFTFEGQHSNQPEGRNVTNNSDDNELAAYKNFYILKTSQSLFIITRDAFEFSDDEDDERDYYNTKRIQVYEVDMSTGRRAEINNIGSMAIFIGYNATFAVDSSRFYGKIKGNRIYFTDDDDGWETYPIYDKKGGGKDIGAYNMETKTIESFYSGSEEVLLSKVSPSIWITPSF